MTHSGQKAGHPGGHLSARAVREARAGRAGDLHILEMLDLRDHEGLEMAAIAARMGTTKNAVIGALSRVNRAADAVRCRCRRAANRDGGQRRRWWAS